MFYKPYKWVCQTVRTFRSKFKLVQRDWGAEDQDDEEEEHDEM